MQADSFMLCNTAGAQSKAPGTARAALLARSRVPRSPLPAHVPQQQQQQQLPERHQRQLSSLNSDHVTSVMLQAGAAMAAGQPRYMHPEASICQQQQQQQQQQQVHMPLSPDSRTGMPSSLHGVPFSQPGAPYNRAGVPLETRQSWSMFSGAPDRWQGPHAAGQPAHMHTLPSAAFTSPVTQQHAHALVHASGNGVPGHQAGPGAHVVPCYGLGQSNSQARLQLPGSEQGGYEQQWCHGRNAVPSQHPAAAAAVAVSPWVQHAWYPALPGGYQPPLNGLGMHSTLMQQPSVLSLPDAAQPGVHQALVQQQRQHGHRQAGSFVWNGTTMKLQLIRLLCPKSGPHFLWGQSLCSVIAQKQLCELSPVLFLHLCVNRKESSRRTT